MHMRKSSNSLERESIEKVAADNPRVKIIAYLRRHETATIGELKESDEIDLHNRGNISTYLHQLRDPTRLPESKQPADASEMDPIVECEWTGTPPNNTKQWFLADGHQDETVVREEVVREEVPVSSFLEWRIMSVAAVPMLIAGVLLLYETYIKATVLPEEMFFGWSVGAFVVLGVIAYIHG